MVDWNLIGEVPDSEDDDAFESQPQLQRPPLTPDLPKNTTQITPDIWEIIITDDEDNARKSTLAETTDPKLSVDSSPLSSYRSVEGIQPGYSQGRASNTESIDIILDKPNLYGPDVSNDGPESHIQADYTNSVPLDDHGVVTPSTNRLSEPIQDEGQNNEDSGHQVMDDDQLRLHAIRLERSLRPRKPIQEHPYMIENAHYSSFLRQHGVKPVQLAQKRTRHDTDTSVAIDGDSQDSILPPIYEENLPYINDDADAVFSSSPPESAAALRHQRHDILQHSSQGVSFSDPNISDAELPTVTELLNRVGADGRSKPGRTPASANRKRRRLDVINSDPFEGSTHLRRNTDTDQRAQLDKASYNVSTNQSTKKKHLENVGLDFPEQSKSGAVVDMDSSTEGELTDVPSLNNQQTIENDFSDTSVDGQSALVHRIGRSIKRVLPASWLRLDQQASRDKVQKNMTKSRNNRFNGREGRENRRGVAQPRQVPIADQTALWPFDESEEETVLLEPRQATEPEIERRQAILDFQRDENHDIYPIVSSDDDGSVIEIDKIDDMGGGNKRQVSLEQSFGRQKKRIKPATSGHRGLSKDLSITKSIPTSTSRAKATPNPLGSIRKNRSDNNKASINRKKKQSRINQASMASSKYTRKNAAPKLSILDIIEPDAPRFLKIAARTARKRADQGRSSPSRKTIKLATRRDHVDVTNVLNEWKLGLIPPKTAVSKARHQSTQRPRKQRSSRDDNQFARTRSEGSLSALFGKIPRKLTAKADTSTQIPPKASVSGTKSIKRSHLHIGTGVTAASHTSRPAQLEDDEIMEASSREFHFRKKFLDQVYSAHRRNVGIVNDTVDSNNDFQRQLHGQYHPNRQEIPQEVARPSNHLHPRAKRKKSRVPQRLNVLAPKYRYADDPVSLPDHVSLNPVSAMGVEAINTNRLKGLGPFGTQYTCHFEIFPLESGVFFHESTLIGSGAIKSMCKAADLLYSDTPRQRSIFLLGEKVLSWGYWNEQVSSEFGILFDYAAEQSEEGSRTHSPFLSNALSAVRFVYTYIRDSLQFTAPAELKLFATKIFESLLAFHERIDRCYHAGIQHSAPLLVIQTLDILILIALSNLELCRSDSNLVNEQYQAEDLLKSIAKLFISLLNRYGLVALKSSYDEMDTLSSRERGLKDDNPVIHSWVLVMKVLQRAQILRCSFWEITREIIAPQNLVASGDVKVHEKVWETLFTLLPLCEFNELGVVVAEGRQDANLEGWIIPQALLRQILKVYTENPRQPPSFNNYCRAMLSRCYRLVDQWFWNRSSSIIGVIFDFFGTQNLEHLRNEEAYRSPQFLEDLANSPSLMIEPEDKCFHIFLKLLARSIQRLGSVGGLKDIRNLVARTIPNHNRHYLKEQNIHERDLSALRNHHDLLCTLFWAAPPELRPQISLLEQLIVPSSSHKEACLINLRAWNQLSRFIVGQRQAGLYFKPLLQWQSTFFQQILQQLDSVASDIQQQLHALPKDITGSISNELIDSMIRMNKKAVIEVLHASVSCSLDVMRHAPDLETAMFSFNTTQLQKIFKQFSILPTEFDWSILKTSLLTLDSFLSLVDGFKDGEASQETESQMLESAQVDDALLVVDHELSRSFFSMMRCLLSSYRSLNNDDRDTGAGDRLWCSENGILLAARLSRRFIEGGLIGIGSIFKLQQQYGLFQGKVYELEPGHRKYLVLFMATLLKLGITNISQLDFSLLELWLLSIVKPSSYMQFEHLIAQQICLAGEGLVPEIPFENPSSIVDYSTRRQLFEFAIASMRRSLRDAGPSIKKVLLLEYARALKWTMEQMKKDLTAIVSQPAEHEVYVAFVQDIISLMRAHGADMCTIDTFYYQITKEYSPSTQDPQLQIAGLVSYGLRVRDGDTRVTQQLFFFLLNSVKQAIISDRISDEVSLLQKGLSDSGILTFVLGKFFPAVVTATFREPLAFPLLDVYSTALFRFLQGTTFARELTEEHFSLVGLVMSSAILGIQHVLQSDSPLSLEYFHIIGQTIATLNLFWPSLLVQILNAPSSSTILNSILESTKSTAALARKSFECLEQLLQFNTIEEPVANMMTFNGLSGVTSINSLPKDPNVSSFADQIVEDVQRNWIYTVDRINIQSAGKLRGSTWGISRPIFEREVVLEGVKVAIQEWLCWWNKAYGCRKESSSCSWIEEREGLFF